MARWLGAGTGLPEPRPLASRSNPDIARDGSTLTTEDTRELSVEQRNASAAVIGAGDFIGAAIAKRFAAEGFTVFAGRRNGDKLAPLVAEIEAGGGPIVVRSLDAPKEDEVTAFLNDSDQQAPPAVFIFDVP